MEEVAKMPKYQHQHLILNPEKSTSNPLFKPENTHRKPCVESNCLGGNWLSKK